MKRRIFFVLLFAIAGTSLWAGKAKPETIDLHLGKTKPIPTTRPMSEDVYSFSAYAIETAVVLTSETVSGSVYVSLLGPSGIVFYTSETMSVGSELSIAVSSFPVGIYAIFVRYNSTILVGEFEIVDDNY